MITGNKIKGIYEEMKKTIKESIINRNGAIIKNIFGKDSKGDSLYQKLNIHLATVNKLYEKYKEKVIRTTLGKEELPTSEKLVSDFKKTYGTIINKTSLHEIEKISLEGLRRYQEEYIPYKEQEKLWMKQ